MRNADEDPIWEMQEINQEGDKLCELEESLEARGAGRSENWKHSELENQGGTHKYNGVSTDHNLALNTMMPGVNILVMREIGVRCAEEHPTKRIHDH